MKSKLIIAALALVLGFTPHYSTAQENESTGKTGCTLEASVDWKSKYILISGNELAQGPVLQPTLRIGCEDITITLWSNYDRPRNEFNEFDLIVGYSKKLGTHTVSAGYNSFFFPTGLIPLVNEIYIGYSHDRPFGFDVTLFQGFIRNGGRYTVATATVNESFNFFGSTLELNSRVYFSLRGVRVSEPDLDYWRKSLTFMFPFKNVTFKLGLDHYNSSNSNISNHVVGVLGISHKF